MSKIFKFLTKLSLIILLVVGVSGVIALWSVGLFIPHAVENAFNENTSFDLKIRSSKVKLWRGLVSFENAFITNPSRFVSHELTHIKKLKVDAAMTLGLLLHRDLSHLILQEVIIDLENIHWIKNPNGEVNLTTLARELTKEIYGDSSASTAPALPGSNQSADLTKGTLPVKKSSGMPFISTFKFKLNTVYYEDYSNSAAPVVKKYLLTTSGLFITSVISVKSSFLSVKTLWHGVFTF